MESLLKRKYSEPSLSIAKMYDLYREWCVEKHLTLAKEWLHREVFNTEYNFALHKQKKDLCDFYEKFKGIPSLDEEMRNEKNKTDFIKKGKMKQESTRKLTKKNQRKMQSMCWLCLI